MSVIASTLDSPVDPLSDQDPASESALSDSGDDDEAPRYTIPSTTMGAVEVPAIVDNVDRAVTAFGRVPDLRHTLDPSRKAVPIYLNPESPFCKPLHSHNARSNNVVLKITVPKRTGRKRKRGSNEPWSGDVDVGSSEEHPTGQRVLSQARLDHPDSLRQRLEDTKDQYSVEAVGTIKHTHRFRGYADFYWDMSRSSFAKRYMDQVFTKDVKTIKSFRFQPGLDSGPQVDVLPPPILTHTALPFNYAYSQNPYVRSTEDGDTINVTAIKMVGHFVGADDPTPTGPQEEADRSDPQVAKVLEKIEELFQERTIWTRRSLLNRLGDVLSSWNDLKKHLNYVAYQFKGGPWRDAVVPYGIDPRTSPEYRKFQTVMFKLQRRTDLRSGQSWHSIRREQAGLQRDSLQEGSSSHIFDGQVYHGDSKVWQVCDITDPLLRRILEDATPRDTWDMVSGWYHGGLWAKVKGIMKTKLVALQFGRRIPDAEFASTLQAGDATPTRAGIQSFTLPLPNLDLTEQELRQMGKKPGGRRSTAGYVTKVRDYSRSVGPSGSPATTVGGPRGGEAGMVDDDDEDDSHSGGDEEEGVEDIDRDDDDAGDAEEGQEDRNNDNDDGGDDMETEEYM